MPFRYRKNHDQDVEYFEPIVESTHDAADIADFINQLQEPQRSICSAVVLDGEKISNVAAVHHLTRYRIGKILRASLRPLAEELQIVRRPGTSKGGRP